MDESYSAVLAARYLNATVSPVHLVWDPLEGVVVQMLPAETTGLYRGIPRHTVQIYVTGVRPFTSTPMRGLTEILEWLDVLDIPRSWPHGPPVSDMSTRTDQPGHYALHAGAVSIDHLFSRTP